MNGLIVGPLAGPIRVLVVDDQELVRTGFCVILEAADGISVVAEAADGRRQSTPPPTTGQTSS